MKTFSVFLAFAALALAAQAPTYMQSHETLSIVHVEPEFDNAGVPTTFIIVADFAARLENVANLADFKVVPVGNVRIDCVQNGKRTVANSGKVYTYEEIARALTAIAYQEWRAAHPPVFRPHRGIRETPAQKP